MATKASSVVLLPAGTPAKIFKKYLTEVGQKGQSFKNKPMSRKQSSKELELV